MMGFDLKKLFSIIIGMAISFFVWANRQPNYQTAFGHRDACFLLSQLSTGKIIEEYNPQRCAVRFPPCSSFKIAAALMAFEKGVLKDENQLIKWDGTHHDRKDLNQDLTPLTWMENSAIWVTRWIMPQLKLPEIKKFLKDFSYGNQDFSGGITQAWQDSSLEISAYEQLTFLNKLWKETLPLSRTTFQRTKKIIFIQNLVPKSELYGKTGTGCLDKGCDRHAGRMLGWFVGFIKTDKDVYTFVANTSDKNLEKKAAGPRLRKTVVQLIKEMKVMTE